MSINSAKQDAAFKKDNTLCRGHILRLYTGHYFWAQASGVQILF